MNYYGYAGEILYIDLTSRKVKKEPLSEELIKGYIGSLGINTRLLYDLNEPGIDPVSPKNHLIFGTGPLGGTLAPSCSRSEATGKSPLTNFFGTTNAGDSVALMAKFAGYDHLVISGKAEGPVYLKISDEEVEICDANHLWGKDIWEATDRLWEELGDYWVNCIGPAGENLIRYACSITNKHSVYSRTGVGAIMGSKNLKAIAAKGSKGITIADEKAFMKLVDEISGKIRSNPTTQMWRDLGFVVALSGYAATGLFERHNYAEGFPEVSQVFSQEEYKRRIVKKSYACPSCSVGCRQVVEIKDGRYAGLNYKVAALGSQVGYHNSSGIEDWDELAKCVEFENRMGIDSTSLSGSIGFAIELYKKGILTKHDTDGMELDWGGKTIQALTEKIVRREGIGNILADGVRAAVERFGPETARYASHAKGLEIAVGIRGRISTENFGQYTNPRGGHIDRSASLTFAPRKAKAFPPFCEGIGVPQERIDRICDGPEGFNVSRLTKWVEDYNTVLICMGMCHRTPVTQQFNIQVITDLYKAATGIEISPAELRKAGERIWNLQRAFNQREGGDRKNDTFTWRSLNEPINIGEKEFQPFDIDRANKILDEYYEEREWNVKDGTLSREKMEELGLSDVASDLGC
jgi:aldehyde:ferredoxin oxidoreductase